MPVSVLFIYPVICYTLFIVYLEVVMIEKSAKAQEEMAEFATFNISPLGVSYSLPLVVPMFLYVITRAKFMFLEEGN